MTRGGPHLQTLRVTHVYPARSRGVGVVPCGQTRLCTTRPRADTSPQMSKRNQDTLDRETQEAKDNEVRIRLTGLLKKNVTDPGILAVLVDRKERIIMTMFTYSLTTIMNPSDHGAKTASERLVGNEEFQKLTDEAKYFNIKHFACGVDTLNRRLAGGTIVQAVMSCAAGLNTIMYSDDLNLESKEIAKKLNWSRKWKGTTGITETVCAVMGCVGDIDNNAMEAFNPDVFERDFLVKLDDEIPALHFVQTLNKIVFYDLTESDTLDDVTPTSTHTTTTEVNTPDFPLPF